MNKAFASLGCVAAILLATGCGSYPESSEPSTKYQQQAVNNKAVREHIDARLKNMNASQKLLYLGTWGCATDMTTLGIFGKEFSDSALLKHYNWINDKYNQVYRESKDELQDAGGSGAPGSLAEAETFLCKGEGPVG